MREMSERGEDQRDVERGNERGEEGRERGRERESGRKREVSISILIGSSFYWNNF